MLLFSPLSVALVPFEWNALGDNTTKTSMRQDVLHGLTHQRTHAIQKENQKDNQNNNRTYFLA